LLTSVTLLISSCTKSYLPAELTLVNLSCSCKFHLQIRTCSWKRNESVL